jgi:RimJ/RimL family protein N-acetyltransferase
VSEPSSPSPFATGVVLGACAGLFAGYADIASTVFWLAPGADRAWLVAVFLAVGLATGTLTGALVGALDAVLARWIARVFVRHAVALVVPFALVAHLLFAGGKMRRLPAQWALKPLVALALVAVSAWALTALRRFVVSASERPRRVRFVFGGAFLVIGWLVHGLDHRVLPRLYEYLHAGLGAMTALAFAAGVALIAPSLWRETSSRRTRLAWVYGALALAAVPLSARWLDARPNVRAEVFGTHAPFVRHACLAVATLTAAPEGRNIDSAALRRARLARGQTAQSSATDGLPRVSGAHLLLITVDALRADRLGRVVNGHSVTPTLDGLAARGVVFERTYTQAPHSSYSLSSLHTGEYLHETVSLGQPQPLVTLASAMRADGRLTAALYTRGIFFTEGERLYPYRDTDFGFARSAHVDRDADAQTEAATRELDDIVRRGEPPSFLWVHYFDAHAPYQGRGATAEAQYDDAVARIDRALGRLFEHARRTLARDAVIAVTADHGEEFGEHGGVYHGSALYDEQVRVPLVIAAPGVSPLTGDPEGSSARTRQLTDILLRISEMACELPALRNLELPVRLGETAALCGLSIRLRPWSGESWRYGHMAICPYPLSLEKVAHGKDRKEFRLRPIRPEDADAFQEFVRGLSERSRYTRFFGSLRELSREQLVRHTQIDYDREMVLVATERDEHAVESIIGEASYTVLPDSHGCEFGVVVADRVAGRGIATQLMGSLLDAARQRGLRTMVGEVLKDNGPMKGLVSSLGFAVAQADDPDILKVTRKLNDR